MGLFYDVTLHGLTSQLIRSPAGLVGYAGEFGFLLGAE
jgi:hypothetical protein